MLKIRDQQMAVFHEQALQDFDRRMVAHLKKHFPRHCEILGEKSTVEVIRYGLERAKTYHVTSESGVRVFTDLMFLLGRGFDTDVQLPWAAEILKDESVPNEATRIQRLYDEAMGYLDRVSGPKNEHIDEAQRRIQRVQLDPPPPAAPEEFSAYMVRRLGDVFPQKCAHVGEANLRKLIPIGIEGAKRYHITANLGVMVYIGLMFMLGSSFDTDPQFAWAGKILRDDSNPDQDAKIAQLYAGAMAYLNQWCAAPPTG